MNKSYTRVAWEDRFNTPTVKQLRSGLPGRVRPLFDRTRKSLLELDGVVESQGWYGASWKWSIEFYTKGKRGKLSDEPLAVLIPSPEDLQLAVPLEREFVSSLSMKRMKRAIKDGLELAQEPFDTHWGVWSVGAMNLLEDLQDLIELKLRYCSSKAAAG